MSASVEGSSTLTIVTPHSGDGGGPLYRRLRQITHGMLIRDIATVDMGGFLISFGASRQALMTDGAGPCMIIVIHFRKGVGALGHYAAESDSAEIVRVIRTMVNRMREHVGHANPACIALSAGSIGKDVDSYFERCIAGIRALYPGAKVSLVSPPHEHRADMSEYGSCIYVPDFEAGAFSDDSVGSYGGDGSGTIKKFNFGP